MSNILIIAAHPDDEIIGCGATIFKLKKKNLIKVLFICKTFDNRKDLKTTENYDQRKKIAIKVSKKIGILNPVFLNYEGLAIQRKQITEIANNIYDQIIKFKPKIIFTHCINDLHHDHRVAAEATLIATRPKKQLIFLKQIFSYEIPSATEYLIKKNKVFNPNYFVDVSKFYRKKIQILNKFYSKELRPYPNIRSIKSIKNIMKYRGNQVNLNFAESFEIIRNIG
jgi:LmbE family N-acetylglucosaminyl deacetylase